MNKLKGSVDAIRFRNPQNGWTVLQLDVAGLPGGVSVVGSLCSSHAGARLDAVLCPTKLNAVLQNNP